MYSSSKSVNVRNAMYELPQRLGNSFSISAMDLVVSIGRLGGLVSIFVYIQIRNKYIPLVGCSSKELQLILGRTYGQTI